MSQSNSRPRPVHVLFKTGQQADFYATDETIAQIAADIRDERLVGQYQGWPMTTHGGYTSSNPPSPIILSLPNILYLG